LNIAVAITVNDRPEYLGRVIESWHQVRGIEDVPVVFQVEPKSDECRDMCLKAGFPKQFVQINQVQRGALGNPYYAIETGFSVLGTEFVLLGEDDSTVSADVLEYVDYAARTFVKKPNALAVCTFQYKPLVLGYFVHARHYFASVVWGTWRDRWDEIRQQWRFDYTWPWDRMLVDMVAGEKYCVFPGFSRSQHIGKYNGTHMNETDFETLQAKRVHDGSKQYYRVTGEW
jgi:hypothetical protein